MAKPAARYSHGLTSFQVGHGMTRSGKLLPDAFDYACIAFDRKSVYNESVNVGVSCAERHVARLIEVNLTRQGSAVTSWFSPAETIRDLPARPLDTLIIDPENAEARVHEIASAARALYPSVRIVVLGHNDGSGDGDLYLRKPFSVTDIFRGGPPPPAAYA